MKGEEMSNLEIVAHNNRGTIYLGDIPSGLYLFEVIRSDGKVLIGKFNKA